MARRKSADMRVTAGIAAKGCLLLLLCLLLDVSAAANTWFPPSPTWLAQRLRDVGLQTVRHRGPAVGGMWESGQPGPTVVFSSNDPLAAIDVLGALGQPQQGRILAVFGPEVELQRGDYLIKVDFSNTLAPHQVALPLSGPSIDSFELVISKGTRMPVLAIASDLVLCLQNRAHTASELVVVQLEDYRPLSDGQMAVDLSLRVFDPTLRDRASQALLEISQERLALHGAKLISSDRHAAPESGHWPAVREALGQDLEVLQEAPLQTPLYQEDFGRPHMPALTVRVGSTGRATIEALARVLRMSLTLEPRSPDPKS